MPSIISQPSLDVLIFSLEHERNGYIEGTAEIIRMIVVIVSIFVRILTIDIFLHLIISISNYSPSHIFDLSFSPRLLPHKIAYFYVYFSIGSDVSIGSGLVSPSSSTFFSLAVSSSFFSSTLGFGLGLCIIGLTKSITSLFLA